MAELPIMPLYTDSWTGDVSDLPNALYGAYMRLIVRWWREGALPEPNERKLARWAQLTTADFEDLKEFLTETENGWIQSKLMRTYAEQLVKSIKAQKSANARHGNSERNEEYEERIAQAYACRMLSMIHDPCSKVEGSSEPSTSKKKNKKRKAQPAATSAPMASTFPLPDDLEIRRVIERLRVKHGYGKLLTYLVFDGGCAIERFGEKYLVSAETDIKADMIDQRLGGDLNEILGRGNWEIQVRKLAA